MHPKFRASYSILNVWASGNWEQAIKYYFKLEDFKTPAMVEGNKWHDLWAEHVKKTKTMPVEFGSKALKDPQVEIYTKISINDWLDLSGKIDCLDKPTIYEWKTGKTSSESYASSKQGGVYGVLATLAGHYVEQIEIHHYDQHNKKADMSLVWITDQLLKDSMDWIESIASEMHNYFLENDLYSQFGKSRLAFSGQASEKG